MSNAPRLITLILLLQRQPNQKAGELAAQLGVSVRTLHRYLGMLEEMGIPIYSERGPYGGFSLVRGYRMPPLIFTPEEAVAVYLGASLVEEIWGQLYQQAAAGALAKLDNVLPDEQREEIAWARRSLVATDMQRSDPGALAPWLEKLRRAVRERRRVHLSYRSSSQTEAQERDLDPYALVHRWGWWYVLGHCHLRQALRSFRVDRILGLTLLAQTFEIPAGFDVHAFLEQEFQNQPGVQARMRFLPAAAHIALANHASWETLEEQPDGSVIVTYRSPDLVWASSLALSFGPLVVVLAPEELRQELRTWAQEIAGFYPPQPNSEEETC